MNNEMLGYANQLGLLRLAMRILNDMTRMRPDRQGVSFGQKATTTLYTHAQSDTQPEEFVIHRPKAVTLPNNCLETKPFALRVMPKRNHLPPVLLAVYL